MGMATPHPSHPPPPRLSASQPFHTHTHHPQRLTQAMAVTVTASKWQADPPPRYTSPPLFRSSIWSRASVVSALLLVIRLLIPFIIFRDNVKRKSVCEHILVLQAMVWPWLTNASTFQIPWESRLAVRIIAETMKRCQDQPLRVVPPRRTVHVRS